MANTKNYSLESLIAKLYEINDKLQRVEGEISSCRDLWMKDGDSRHSDICFKKFVELLGEFYTVQELVSVAQSPFIADCSVDKFMKELGAKLEDSLSMAMQARAKYMRDKKIFDLQIQYEDDFEDDHEPIDDTIEHLFIDDESVANLSMSILCFENSWLREQKRPKKMTIPNIKLTDSESNILEALNEDTMTGPELLKKAGYDNSSHYRTTLSNLVKRGILEKTGQGYRHSQVI